MKAFARGVFLFEAIIINFLVGAFVFFFPSGFVANFTNDVVSAVPLELIRWYGVLLFVLSFAMLRALALRSQEGVRIVVEALLVGDFAHLVASYLFFQNGGAWNFASVTMMISTVTLILIRSYWLRYIRQV
jgi:hypothetical protein